MQITNQELIQSAAYPKSGINVRIKGHKKARNIPVIKLERELKSCMNCKYFYSNSRQCILDNCTSGEEKQSAPYTSHPCHQCPYRIDDRYCFPCMRKIMGQDVTEKEKNENG